ncbi:uncharacterized protein N7515_002886 [Penicillium bovifimosum]|uniref:Uncharacterized protein n=1 Tax=Penicillium bovifimosum TaxID=126998 RepID=A0A9W9HCK3_9EURO|nr:uncharacterized protein N7515_002886 [Penicillium bovifimosum]KAJ5144099.1 hypothetical protein N7515_002886 [Penicillium bovifimosum]
MQPPTDSLRHQLHKLAELRANRNAAANHNAGSGSTTTPTPASPHYTLSITRPSGTRVMTVPNYLADQDDYMDPSPINITIDRSVTLIGDGNNIQLPESGLSSQPDQTDGSGTRLTSLAAVIIGALNRADNLVDQTGNPRPLNINIRNGLHVQGSNNTVCAVSTVGETAQNAESDSADGPSSPSQAAQTETVPAGSGEAEGGDRKRRADSVRTPFRQRGL